MIASIRSVIHKTRLSFQWIAQKPWLSQITMSLQLLLRTTKQVKQLVISPRVAMTRWIKSCKVRTSKFQIVVDQSSSEGTYSSKSVAGRHVHRRLNILRKNSLSRLLKVDLMVLFRHLIFELRCQILNNTQTLEVSFAAENNQRIQYYQHQLTKQTAISNEGIK